MLRVKGLGAFDWGWGVVVQGLGGLRAIEGLGCARIGLPGMGAWGEGGGFTGLCE